MTYKAIVCQLKNVQKHVNADRLQVAEAIGNTVIVGMDTKEDDLGIYFDVDGQLSLEFATANKLLKDIDPETKVNKGGFFDSNRKVRAQKFRGIKSCGFWCPISYLDFTIPKDQTYSDYFQKPGEQFDTFNGIPICNKYFTPATIRAMNRGKGSQGKQERRIQTFPKHRDTEQLRHSINFIKEGSILYFSEKVHGTSFRFGNVYVNEELPRKWYHKLFFQHPKFIGYKEINGTRNTICGEGKTFYSSEKFREKVVEPIRGKLHKGEVLYGEIVGYTDHGQPIMHSASNKDLGKEFIKQYGEQTHFKYGCSPTNTPEQQKIFIYRIAMTNEDGVITELSWPQVKSRCMELNLNPVPELTSANVFADNSEINDVAELKSEGPSTIDHSHIKEGVVIRVEPPTGIPYWLKHKSYEFKVLEGIVKVDDTAVDMEEVS